MRGRIDTELVVGLLVFTAVATVCIGSCTGCHVQTSDGDRMGVVTKFSRKGLAIKTWEGEAILGSSDVPGVGTTWAFTVDDAGPVAAVAAAMRDGHKIRMHYTEFFVGGKWHGDTAYRVTSIEPVEKKQEAPR